MYEELPVVPVFEPSQAFMTSYRGTVPAWAMSEEFLVVPAFESLPAAITTSASGTVPAWAMYEEFLVVPMFEDFLRR